MSLKIIIIYFFENLTFFMFLSIFENSFTELTYYSICSVLKTVKVTVVYGWATSKFINIQLGKMTAKDET